MPIFELDPVDHIAVAAVGEPGRRQFFLLAIGAGRTLTLSCEKSQIQALLVRLQQMIEAQDLGGVTPAGGDSGLEPGEPEWKVGEEGAGDDAPSVRFWLSHKQVVAFSKQAETVLGAGRPLCPRCGLPMDPAGHPCPVSNGARPIF